MTDVMTGARAIFSFNGVRVGYATDVSISDAIAYDELEVLGNFRIEEYVPIGYRVETFTARMFRIVGKTITSQNWFPAKGTTPEKHLENVLTSGDLSATIEDSGTGKILNTVERVKIASKSMQISARGVVATDISMVAIVVKDESEVL